MNFDDYAAKITNKQAPTVHGFIAKCIDKTGKQIYSKVAGYDSVFPDAQPLQADAVFKIASATKIITTIAVLQCVERGLFSLDEPIARILPELGNKPIIRAGASPSDPFTLHPSQTPITARHLLTHTSGLGYDFIDPLLQQWVRAQNRGPSHYVVEKYDLPLRFEPGEGWAYGCGVDWAGVAVSRATGVNLEDYLRREIWLPLGRNPPFPTFHISRYEAYKTRLMKPARRREDGGLEPHGFLSGDNPVDQEGGNGYAMTVEDHLCVLQDLIAEKPKLLKVETVEGLFAPQLGGNLPALDMLRESRSTWDMLAGPVRDEDVDHGLGGLWISGAAQEIGQPANFIAWAGVTNVVWFANRELGVAGFLGTQIGPFGDAAVHELVNAWKKDFWSKEAKSKTYTTEGTGS